ncbi:MAG: FAD-binding protein, partial [Segetibacter sp.]
MIIRNGPTSWKSIHATVKLTLEDLIDIDNSNSKGLLLSKYELLNQATTDINDLIKKARQNKKRIRAIGSGWALSHIQITDNWLLNTKLLNECFEADDESFDNAYPKDKRKLLVIAQCGISIAELNDYLELPKSRDRIARSLKTAGIGAGQTIVGAVSGNTHGAAVNFGAIPDFVVAIQLCNGTDKPLWIERNDYPVMNHVFTDKVKCTLIRDTDIFNSALVNFGAFGVITAFAIETEPIYHINFPKVQEINLEKIKSLFSDPSYYGKIRHLEFVFNPYDEDTFYLIEGTRVDYEEGHPNPRPLWILSNKLGYAPGDLTTKLLLKTPLVSGRKKNQILFEEYLKNGVLSEVRGTSGQLFTATITYLEGYNETAFAVSI